MYHVRTNKAYTAALSHICIEHKLTSHETSTGGRFWVGDSEKGQYLGNIHNLSLGVEELTCKKIDLLKMSIEFEYNGKVD